MLRKTLLGLFVLTMVIGLSNTANAASGDSKTVNINASMDAHVSVVIDPSATVNSTKIALNGTLSPQPVAAFIVTTNSSSGASVTYSAKVQTNDAGLVDALVNAGPSSNYIVMGNTSNQPAKAAVLNALDGSVEPLNPNAIGYNAIVTGPGGNVLNFTVPFGNTATNLKIDGLKPQTFGGADTDGNYAVDVTCSAAAI